MTRIVVESIEMFVCLKCLFISAFIQIAISQDYFDDVFEHNLRNSSFNSLVSKKNLDFSLESIGPYREQVYEINVYGELP